MENSDRGLISVQGRKLEKMRALISLYEKLGNRCENNNSWKQLRI